MRKVVRRQPELPVTHAEDALSQLQQDLEATPVPADRRARRQRIRELKRAEAMIDWHDVRQEGKAAFLWRGSRFVPGMALIGLVTAATVVLSGKLLTVLRVALLLGFGVALVLNALLLGHLVWTAAERNYALWLGRAQARLDIPG